MVIKLATKTAGNAGTKTGDSQMRTFSFMLAFAFAYSGSIAPSAPQTLVVAAN